MKALFDVLGAPGGSGGMRQYAEEMITAWLDQFPEDEIIVLGDRWVESAFGAARVQHVRWGSERFIPRAFGQLLLAGALHRKLHCDVTISTSTIVSPLVPHPQRICIVHDWRHLRRPQEFGLGQRLYRRLWLRSARAAGALVSISKKTLSESRRFVPSARHALVVSGYDHARRWSTAEPAVGGHLLTFGHHANKRPDLVIRAFAHAALSPDHELVVLGARGDFAKELRRLAAEVGIEASVQLPGFVDEGTYRRLVTGAGAIVLASSDEGFGLPGAEAAYFGIPFVVASDGGLDEVHDRAIVADPDERSLAAALRFALTSSRTSAVAAPQRTWAETAMELRDLATPAMGDGWR